MLALLCVFSLSNSELAGLPEGGSGRNGDNAVSLGDVLGPVVVGKDGSTSRIANWHTMTAGEKERTHRIIGARNRKRFAQLRAQGRDVRLSKPREEL